MAGDGDETIAQAMKMEKRKGLAYMLLQVMGDHVAERKLRAA